ncbi:MAG: NAD(P)-dependent oxidoreductase [Pseudomonadota bacterium]
MKANVGFIGLGNMGGPMAENLLAAGFPLTVLDLNPEPMRRLVAAGAKSATTPRELAMQSEFICSVVMNDRQTREVMLGPDGVLAGASPNSVILLHSTLSVAMCRELAAEAKPHRVAVVDAAVSGAAERSRDGTLSLMVGGDPDAIRRCEPLFDVVGEKIYRLGELGMGQTAKLCNNLMSLVNVHIVEEALRLARSAGIDEEKMLEVARASSGDSWSLRNIENMRKLAALHTGGEVDMRIFGRKDISLAVKLSQYLGADTPITDFVFEQTKR